jgi:hypothetical protein
MPALNAHEKLHNLAQNFVIFRLSDSPLPSSAICLRASRRPLSQCLCFLVEQDSSLPSRQSHVAAKHPASTLGCVSEVPMSVIQDYALTISVVLILFVIGCILHSLDWKRNL